MCYRVTPQSSSFKVAFLYWPEEKASLMGSIWLFMGLFSCLLLYFMKPSLLVKQLFARFVPSRSKTSQPYSLAVFSSL